MGQSGKRREKERQNYGDSIRKFIRQPARVAARKKYVHRIIGLKLLHIRKCASETRYSAIFRSCFPPHNTEFDECWLVWVGIAPSSAQPAKRSKILQPPLPHSGSCIFLSFPDISREDFRLSPTYNFIPRVICCSIERNRSSQNWPLEYGVEGWVWYTTAWRRYYDLQ